MPDIKSDKQEDKEPAVEQVPHHVAKKLSPEEVKKYHDMVLSVIGEKETPAAVNRQVKPPEFNRKIEVAPRGKEKPVRPEMVGEKSSADKTAPVAIAPIGGAAAAQAKTQKQIERVMADGLESIYLSMPLETRRKFKKAGEETARKINQLLAQAKVKIGDIINLIKKWLMLIPGVNKYFLEQEAKIKADELMKLRSLNDK